MCDPRSHFAALHLDLVGPINIVLFGSRVVQSSERLFCLSCTIKMVGARAAYADCDPGKSLRPRNPFPPRKLFPGSQRSEEHTSELQSRGHLVCRLLLEKK